MKTLDKITRHGDSGRHREALIYPMFSVKMWTTNLKIRSNQFNSLADGWTTALGLRIKQMSDRGRARKYDKAIETKLRRCLFTKANGDICGKLFKSTGPGNRKCPACRDSEVLPYQAWMDNDHVISGNNN